MYRIVKQLHPAPSSSADPYWASRDVYVAKLSGSAEQVWEYSTQAAATAKMNELEAADSTERKYKVILV
jgi:hypothetical protein|tara:strand:+ start:8039 stop:8245 length:207 start_codon:yes stop_codon:yes gene_type:complete